MTHKLAFRFDSDPGTLRVVRRLMHNVVLTCGGTEEDARSVETATGEVLINAYEHAYARQPGRLQLDVVYNDTKIELTVHDDGEPITETPVIPTAPPTGTRGRGLFLVGQLMDESAVIHQPHGPRGVGVRMVKYFCRSPKR